MLEASLEPLLSFDFDCFLKFGYRKWREISVHRLHHFLIRIESALIEVLQCQEQPEIARHKLSWVGRMRNNVNIIHLEVLCNDFGGMWLCIVMMEV